MDRETLKAVYEELLEADADPEEAWRQAMEAALQVEYEAEWED